MLGIDENGDGLDVEGSLDGARGVGGNHLVRAGLYTGSSAVVSAGSVLGGVAVAAFSHGEVRLVVSERGRLHTSIASVVRLGAIDELLLGEREEGSGCDEVSTFHGHVGGEGPA